MIPFSKPCAFASGLSYIEDVAKSGKLSGQGPYTNICTRSLEKTLQVSGKVFLTTSGTSALEMAAMTLIKPGDEVILPSFTFVSTVNAFASRGAVLVFRNRSTKTTRNLKYLDQLMPISTKSGRFTVFQVPLPA